MLIVVVIRSITLPGAMEGIKWYLNVDFSKITPQTFLDCTWSMLFSRYCKRWCICLWFIFEKDSNIPEDGLMVIGFDTLVALIAGFATFPAVFVLGIKPDSGSNLLFVTMSNVFMHTFDKYSDLYSSVNVLCGFIKCLGYLEPISSSFSDMLKLSRAKGAIYSLASIL